MSYTYDDCAAQEGPEPDSMPCPDCNTPDHADPRTVSDLCRQLGDGTLLPAGARWAFDGLARRAGVSWRSPALETVEEALAAAEALGCAIEEADYADPFGACPTCGGTGEVDLRAERERVRCEQARRYAEHNAAHWRGVYDLLGIDPDADTEAA
jgi:hypothetical protein